MRSIRFGDDVFALSIISFFSFSFSFIFPIRCFLCASLASPRLRTSLNCCLTDKIYIFCDQWYKTTAKHVVKADDESSEEKKNHHRHHRHQIKPFHIHSVGRKNCRFVFCIAFFHSQWIGKCSFATCVVCFPHFFSRSSIVLDISFVSTILFGQFSE